MHCAITLLFILRIVPQLTGQDYVPAPAGAVPASASAPVNKPSGGAGDDIRAQIDEQGNKVRDLKAQKASKDTITAEVQKLLALKIKYKEVMEKINKRVHNLIRYLFCTCGYYNVQ